MNITNFIKAHKELSELPFLIVFRVIQVLRDKKILELEGDSNVESSQP